MPLEGEEHALGLQRLLHPLDHLAGLLGPSLVQHHADIARLGRGGMVEKRGHVLVMVGLERRVQRTDGLAGRSDLAGLLQHDHLGAVLGSGGGGHQAAVARADDDDVGIHRLGDVGGHLGLVTPGRGVLAGVGGLRAALGRRRGRTGRKSHGRQGAGSGRARQKSTAREIGFHSRSSLVSVPSGPP